MLLEEVNSLPKKVKGSGPSTNELEVPRPGKKANSPGKPGSGRGPTKPVPVTLKKLVRYGRRHLQAVIGVVIAVFVSTALGLVPPWLIRYGIDELVIGNQPQFLWIVAAAMVGVSLLQGLVDFLTRYTTEFVSQNIIHHIRSDLYTHLNRLSFSFYDWSRTGDIMSRLTSDADSLRQFLANASVYISGNVLTIFGILVVMVLWEPRLALLYMLMLPLMAHAMSTYAIRVRPMFQRARRSFARLTHMVQQALVGIEVTKLFAREGFQEQQFTKENDTYVDINVAAAKTSALWMPYVHFLIGLGTSLVIWYGGRLVIDEVISIGTLVGFVGYIAMLMRPIRQTGMMINFSSQAVAAAERIFEVLETAPEIQDTPGAIELPPLAGKVEYRGVGFSYRDGNQVLEDVNLVAEPGETVAIVGPTGAGKSTLIHLLPRFYDPSEGQILVDGQDIREVTLESLRMQIGIVLQHTFLFAASIRENICYGRPEASMDEIINCAKVAQIHDFIKSLPLGYETPVGERGVTLSGGQRQRLAMARVLLTNPRLLILDEPTSSVDAETEERMTKALAQVMQGRTTFVIAHRLWTVQRADQILVVNNHTIVEQGRHEQLVAAGGFYSQICDQMLGSQDPRKGG